MSPILLGWTQPMRASTCGFVPARQPHFQSEPVTDDGEGHTLVLAPTGQGKGRNVLIPTMLTYEGSAVVVDVKGEAAQVTARRRRELGQEVVIVDPFGVSGLPKASLNPLDLLDPQSESLADDAMTMAECISAGRDQARERFWPEKGKDLIAGLIAAVVSDPDPSRRTLGQVWHFLGNHDPVLAMAMLLDERENTMPAYARSQIAGFLGTAELTRSGILSTACQLARCLGTPVIQASLAATSFDLERFRLGDRMTIYLVLPPSKLESHAAVLRLWLSVLLGIIAERRERPELDTLFVVDELGHLGPIPAIQQAVTLLRGYGLKTTLFLQSIAQLSQLWPGSYRTILDNCANVLTFGHTSLTSAREVSEQLGDISGEAVFRLRDDELVIRRARKGTTVARRLDYLVDPHFAGMADRNPRFARFMR